MALCPFLTIAQSCSRVPSDTGYYQYTQCLNGGCELWDEHRKCCALRPPVKKEETNG